MFINVLGEKTGAQNIVTEIKQYQKMATTRTEDGHKQTTKTSSEIQTRRKTENWTTKEEMEGPTPL